jgi:hypothetical protein
MRGDIDTDGLAAANVEHDTEQEKAIRAALGEEDFKKWDMQSYSRKMQLC